MTQLFDTTGFDATTTNDDAAPAPRPARHLRSLPTSSPDLTDRSTQWKLDDSTIEIGRRGIAMARDALREAARRRGGETADTRKAA